MRQVSSENFPALAPRLGKPPETLRSLARPWARLAALAVCAVSTATVGEASGPASATPIRARSPAPRPALSASLDRALALIPEDAMSFFIVPSLKRLNDDLTQLAEATGQGAALGLGRPIDMLKAQFGIGASVDDNGPLVAYYPATGLGLDANAAQPLPVVVVSVTDADAFLAANFRSRADAGVDAYESTAEAAAGTTFFARKFAGRVALATTREALPAAEGMRGIGERFRARLRSDDRADEAAWLARADVVAWGSRDALHASVERARRAPLADLAEAGVPAGFAGLDALAFDPTRQKFFDIADMLADGIVAIDFDPLGVFLASVGVAEPSTPLAAVTAGGAGRAARFDRVPLRSDFYLALSADFDGLGGAAKFGELLDLAGVSRTALPEWIFREGADLASVQFAAYPSRLGVAIGGALNDSALFLRSRNPAGTLARVRASIEAVSGDSAGIRREPVWSDTKELKGGASAAAFEIKETVVDLSQRPGLDFERLIKQFTFGSAGLKGLAKVAGDGVAVTFSQRPDVFGRAIEAATTGKTLATDDTVRSLEEWLPAKPDVEVMVGVGPLVALIGQIASSFVGEAEVKDALPAIPRDAEPVALAVEVGEGRVRTVAVLPAAVLKVAFAAGVRRAATIAPPADERAQETTP